jgi:ribosome-binding protein aMBF1 (putative translation factor)
MKNRLVETCMRNANIETAYELSKRLEVSKELVSTWTRGKSKPDGINTLKLMKLGKISTEQALILMTETPEQRELTLNEVSGMLYIM